MRSALVAMVAGIEGVAGIIMGRACWGTPVRRAVSSQVWAVGVVVECVGLVGRSWPPVVWELMGWRIIKCGGWHAVSIVVRSRSRRSLRWHSQWAPV